MQSLLKSACDVSSFHHFPRMLFHLSSTSLSSFPFRWILVYFCKHYTGFSQQNKTCRRAVKFDSPLLAIQSLPKTRSKYGEGEKFTCTLSLVFVQCFINACFAKLVLMTFMKQGNDDTKQKYYASGAVSYLGAMVASNMALQHINYPTQVVGKSCKPIPVMILGVLIGRKRYAFAKYVYVLMIVIGVCLFMYKDKKSLSSSSSSSLFGMGEALLIISLTLDGFTGAIQERMKTEHKTKSGHMMLNMNLWSTLFLGAALIVTKEVWFFIEFVKRYPYVINNILLFSITSALGQLFIFLTVSEFGPLPCSIVTTTRKFFTVLGSVIIFGNTLRPYQWFGTVLVFTGLALDSFYGKASSDKKK